MQKVIGLYFRPIYLDFVLCFCQKNASFLNSVVRQFLRKSLSIRSRCQIDVDLGIFWKRCFQVPTILDKLFTMKPTYLPQNPDHFTVKKLN